MATGDPICPQCGAMGPHFHNPVVPVVVLKPNEPVRGLVEIKESVKDEDLKKGIETVVTSMVSRFDQELYALTEEELRARWYFIYDATKSKARNLYEFSEMLELYRRTCRRWEEHHWGSSCVVERVRDKYLMPKIHEFLANQETHRG